MKKKKKVDTIYMEKDRDSVCVCVCVCVFILKKGAEHLLAQGASNHRAAPEPANLVS